MAAEGTQEGAVGDEPDDHALGRSRGGWTTKLRLACEQGRKVLSLVVTGGQRGDSPQFVNVLDRIRVPRPAGGRPRTRPDRVLADKAYSSNANRSYLRTLQTLERDGEIVDMSVVDLVPPAVAEFRDTTTSAPACICPESSGGRT